MIDKITGYLETKTNTENVWVTVDTIINELFPNIEQDPETIKEVLEFESVLGFLMLNRTIRIQEDKEIESPNQFKIALESTIKEVLDIRKESALEEMQEELDSFIKSEDYESAAEYRDMISEYKDNSEK